MFFLSTVMTVWSVFWFFHPQIAVDNGFGGVYGDQKADWMVDVIQQYFHDNGEEHLPSFRLTDGILQL